MQKRRVQNLQNTLKKNNDKFSYVGFFARIEDETLAKLRLGFVDMLNPYSLQELLRENGNNIHIFYAISGGLKDIRRGINKLIEQENPDTISWYNQKMTKLNIFKTRR